ncbi:MAG: Holliday junction resolvase RuvX [Oscillospiraceae bacterium]|jgi:putative Holliday junction resolvase|nr:Holliday junction resolvase RuvX [Oscillospiraceae bacterium]
MAVDYGEARTGIAVSDPTGSIAGDAWTIVERDRDALVRKIVAEASDREVRLIVVGFPRNMDGTAGARAVRSAELADMLRGAVGIEVTLWDERLTTVDAHHILDTVGRHGKKRKTVVDAVAASLILEGYLGGRPEVSHFK